jgi:hypothetical protein
MFIFFGCAVVTGNFLSVLIGLHVDYTYLLLVISFALFCRSVIGSPVCVLTEDGMWRPGMVVSMRSVAVGPLLGVLCACSRRTECGGRAWLSA